MEDVKKIKEFLSVDNGSGSGFGFGSGDGYGDGSGDGSGYGYGSGFGSGSGSGSGFGYGSGFGSGSGSGSGLKSVAGKAIYYVDGVPTVFDHIRGACAKGAILKGDLTFEPCWIVKQGGLFAHGKTLHEARDALLEKLFDDMPEEERIAAFVDAHKPGVTYSDKDFFDWHHRLTGSCEMGRMEFARNHGLESLDGSRTVEEFIALCENAYGGGIIKKLKAFYAQQEG